ncbi:MAG TPA: DNA-processing protein DprA [Vicinamibacteria bacterium]|nr:DNA-processing protein DprA [Vicinamibacteria bacterium]
MAALSGRPRPATEPVTTPSTTTDLLTLALAPGLDARAIRLLCARAALADVLARPREHADVLPADAMAPLLDGRARAAADAEERAARAQGISLVGWDEPAYPAWLRETYDPPPVVYAKGLLVPDEGPRAIAVVGARRVTPAGETLARRLAAELAEAGLTVVSGLARGTDTAAHRGALDARGRTVAVLGSGLDRLYPPENADLSRAIVEAGGAVVSELRLGTPPYPQHFPRRNRVIAGWGRGVVVVEAARTSGALQTARSAADEGREVMAVPGHPSMEGAAGTNALLKDGAVLVRHAADVLEALGLDPRPRAVAAASPGTDPVLRALARDVPRGLAEIQERCGLETPAVLARLSELELTAAVRRLPGALFVLHH